MAAASPTPTRQRKVLEKQFSDPKTENPKKRRVGQGDGAGDLKRVRTTAESSERWDAQFEKHGVPDSCRSRLADFLQPWGESRLAETLGLRSFLGDGKDIPPVSTLQVWGPAGTGKTRIVSSYMKEFNIRHIWLDSACFTSVGELHARIAEELRRAAVQEATAAGTSTSVLPKELLNKPRIGRQIRAIDRLDASIRLSLEFLTRSPDSIDENESSRPSKIVIVLDQSQELPRLGNATIEHVLALPEVLKMGNRISIVTVGRLRLTLLGLPSRDPPAIAFRSYTESEAASIVTSSLSKVSGSASSPDLRTFCSSGLMKFAGPSVGMDLRLLRRIGENVLEGGSGQEPLHADSSMSVMQEKVEAVVQQWKCLPNLSKLLETADSQDAAAVSSTAMIRGFTKAEKRLLLSAYLGSHIDKEDDKQLFLPEAVGRRCKRKGAVTRAVDDDLPSFVRAPRPVQFSRLLAIYHKLARRPNLLGPTLLEQLSNLRNAGLLRFSAEHCSWPEPKIVCRAELPLVRACAKDLDVDLTEYLMINGR